MGKPGKVKQLQEGISVRSWLTRTEVKARLKVSYSRLRVYEGYGWLKPQRAAAVGYRQPATHRGRPPSVVYDQREVDEIARRRTLMRRASSAQRAFAAFQRGAGVVDVVVELGVEPSLARELYSDYAEAAGYLLLPGEVAAVLVELGFQVTAETFPNVVRNLLAAARGRMPQSTRGVRFLADRGEHDDEGSLGSSPRRRAGAGGV